MVLDSNVLVERFAVSSSTIVELCHPEGAFVNPNPHICAATMRWIVQCSQHISPDSNVLELYSGKGLMWYKRS